MSGTTDAILILYSIFNSTLSQRKRLYCCFIDYQKAFDSVDRYYLWYKLSKLGIRGKLLSVIKSMYANVRASVLVNGFTTEDFEKNVGLMQGEVLSPILFSLYVNDFENEFFGSDTIPKEIQDLNLFVLLYADDMVIFSESVDGLQKNVRYFI